MEVRVNLVLLAVLIGLFAAGQASDPVAALDPDDAATQELAAMEDAFARQPGDVPLARELADRYLELEKPGLAIAALGAADVSLLDDPMVAHRLARAYESSGRMLDALATARLARAR